MKGLVLAGGRGSRLESLTEGKNKCMYELGGRPLIEYSLRNAIRAGVSELVIVVGYKAESIVNRYGNSYQGRPIRYVIQAERKGLVHAIECSKDTLDGSDFMLFLADEVLFEPKHQDMINHFTNRGIFALCGAVWVEDTSEIRNTYSMIFEERTNRIFRLIEKPRKPPNSLMGTGNCIFKNAIFEYIPHTPINQQRGEKELPDLIQCAIDVGMPVEFFDIGAEYVNINTINDIEKWGKVLFRNESATGH